MKTYSHPDDCYTEWFIVISKWIVIRYWKYFFSHNLKSLKTKLLSLSCFEFFSATICIFKFILLFSENFNTWKSIFERMVIVVNLFKQVKLKCLSVCQANLRSDLIDFYGIFTNFTKHLSRKCLYFLRKN